ncbi:MAG: tRNA(Arg) A34 adenosine deaminase TadA [Candidatus Paceibacteria bacterium]|jgi:tRNA(Arg) A34 adenosine deaminase TadA
MIKPEKKFMELALEAARTSAANGDYGHGAVVVKDGEIIATGYETLKSANDPVNGHAEVDAIRKACQKLQLPYLQDCILYSTAEPCPMCMSAAIWAKMDTVTYAITRNDMIDEMERIKQAGGGEFSWRQIAIPAEYIVEHGEPKVNLVPGFMSEEGKKLFELTKGK